MNVHSTSTSEGLEKVDIFVMANITSTGLAISIADLCDHIRSNPSSAAASMHSVIWYKELHGVQHEFLLLEVRGENKSTPVWLRLERAAKRDYQTSRTLCQRLWQGSQSMFPANDSAIISSSWKRASGTSRTQTIEHITLSSHATLASLGQLLTAFCDVSVNYTLLEVSLMIIECGFL